MNVAYFMVVVFAVTAYGLKGREKICNSSKAQCIWLNEHIHKDYALPLHKILQPHSKPIIFCYESVLTPDTFIHFWDSLDISFTTSKPDELVIYYGGNSSRKIFSAARHNASKTLRLSPFGIHCIGVKHPLETVDDIPFNLDAKLEFWYWYPILLCIGLSLLYLAPTMSRNVGLIYGTGVTIGILASVIVLLYIMSRFMPGKSFLGFGVLAGGYAALGSLAYIMFDSMVELCRHHVEYVIGYVVVTGLISFAIIYWRGGVSNPRSFDLIQWSIQLVGLCVIYVSTPYYGSSIALMILSLVIYSIPPRCNPLLLPLYLLWWFLGCVLMPFSCIYRCLRCLNPWKKTPTLPRLRYITQKEYEEQGRIETDKALKDLRESCKKKKGVTKLIARLNDSNGFTDFISGMDHVSPEERVNHEWATMDDSDLDEDTNNSSYQHTPPSSYQPSLSPPSPRVHPSPPSPARSSNDGSFSSRYYTSPAAGPRVYGRSRDLSGRGDASPLKPSSRHKHW